MISVSSFRFQIDKNMIMTLMIMNAFLFLLFMSNKKEDDDDDDGIGENDFISVSSVQVK